MQRPHSPSLPELVPFSVCGLGGDTLGFEKGCAMQLFEYPSVRYWSKEINGTSTGGRKNSSFSKFAALRPARHKAAAPAETCQSLPERCPWARLGSVLYTYKRLRRVRRRFKHFWSNSLSRPRRFSSNRPMFAFWALGEH